MFQELVAKNYIRETIHIVAGLKTIWKPKLKYVGTS